MDFTGVTIREAVAADLPALHALIERGYRGDSARVGWTHEADLLGGQRTDVAALADILADADQRMLVAEQASALVGCVVLQRTGDARAYLGLLTVDPALQAKGLGRRLIDAAEVLARDWQSSVIELTVIARRRELIEWYERRGYRLTGERRPFPLDDPRFGLPKTRELEFVVLEKTL